MIDPRYADQIKLPGWGEPSQRKLASATIFVVGAGALGGAAAVHLAGAGAGRIAIVDGGQIRDGEMARQVLHFAPEVGMGKADSAAAKLSLLNPDVHVDPFPADLTADNADLILMDADVVLDCSSRADVRLLVNDACLRAGTPFVTAATGALDGACMSVLPAAGACCRCAGEVDSIPDAAGESVETGPQGDAAPGFDLPSRAEHGVYGPVAGAIGSFAAHLALALLLELADSRAGELHRFDGTISEWSSQAIDRSPDCICAKNSAVGNV